MSLNFGLVIRFLSKDKILSSSNLILKPSSFRRGPAPRLIKKIMKETAITARLRIK